MKDIFITGDNVISALGFTSEENFSELRKGTIGIRQVSDDSLSPLSLPLAAVDRDRLEKMFLSAIAERGKSEDPGKFTRLEKMMIVSVQQATKDLDLDVRDSRLQFILSTTKGNIHLLEDKYRLVFDHKRLFLWELARVIAAFFGFERTPLIVSNACISGIVAIMAGARYIRSGSCSHAIVCGGDILSEFIISGFQSFQSLSPKPCRPYDLSRDGLSLGEACGTLVLSDVRPQGSRLVRVMDGSITNDANHISGPSRTGMELALAMTTAMSRSGLDPAQIGFISAHGTATPYNDEMESKAVNLAGLREVPLNSLKGYWGHTLGAAGVIESVASVHSISANTLLGTAGFSSLGVPEPVNVIKDTSEHPLFACLKTASGFGGCNAALVFQKETT